MSESVIADFPARALYDDTYRTDADPCRVLLSEDKLVVVSDDRRIQIALSEVFDIIVSRIPKDLAEFFDQTVLIGYTQRNARRTLLVKGEHDKIDRFALYLYKATLQGDVTQVKHPARKGGRLTDNEFEPVRVFPKPRSVEFVGDDRSFEIDLSIVTDISQVSRSIQGSDRSVLSVRHMTHDQAVTTEIYFSSIRKLNILARYLRLRYFQLLEQLESIDVTDEETEVLITLYSGGTPDLLPGMLGENEGYVDELLERLEEKGLITDQSTGELSTWGQLVVSDRIEDVNV